LDENEDGFLRLSELEAQLPAEGCTFSIDGTITGLKIKIADIFVLGFALIALLGFGRVGGRP
jgi:hypothetical protein